MELYSGQLKNEDFNIRYARGDVFCDDIFTFDVETTSAWLNENGSVIRYHAGKDADYWNELIPLSLCYIWQFSYNSTVYYGRELSDFLHVLNDLPKKENVIIWVHNLSYEFQFLINILTWEKVFARSAHKPIYAISKEYPNITFRCSYMLTRLSLADWGLQIGLPKMVGDLDYEKIRTPKTPLSSKEMGYCARDCEVVYHGILDYLKRYIYQDKIPLTQTGTVRQEVKRRLRGNPYYMRAVKKLLPRNAKEYKILQKVFAGGYTHANRIYAGEVVRGHVEHYDFVSSYPTVMVCEKFPCTPWTYTGDKKIPDPSTYEDYAYLIKIKFYGLQCQTCNTYIQGSKCVGKRLTWDNGRVMAADECELWITEQDFLTIRDSYTWEHEEVTKVYKSAKDYLPKEFINYILDLYENKTKLKNVEGMEDIYLQSKQYINSMFGMMVTAIVQSDVNFFSDGSWSMTNLTEEIVNNYLSDIKSSPAWKAQYFLSYSWGCWVTAYARRNLWKCLLYCDIDSLYSDTDSIFVLGHYDFTWYNEEVTEKLRKVCEVAGIDFVRTRPKTPKGKEKPLGIFDREDDCTEFITLGAKRYCERRAGDGKLHLTVSGINKNAVHILHDDIRNFKDGLNFDKDFPTVNKKLSTYLNEMPPVVWPDGYKSTCHFGINMRRTGYKLTVTDEYKKLIDYFDKLDEHVPEQFLISLRRRYSTNEKI